MYKRINRRIKKKEKEEALGLDYETKEMLGIPETDSDESDSSDEEQSDGGSEESDVEGETKPARTGRRRGPEQLSDSGESVVESSIGGGMEDEDEEGEDEDEEMAGDADDDEDEPPMTVPEAIENPLYFVGKGSEIQACILCPGKELKHAKMVSVHVESSSHIRRMKRFAALAERIGDEEEDPRLLVAALDESVRITPKEKNVKVSSEPRVSRKDRRMAKRERRRERRVTQKSDKPARETQASEVRLSGNNERVIQKKILNRHSRAIAKHKTQSKHPRLHKSSKSKNAVV